MSRKAMFIMKITMYIEHVNIAINTIIYFVIAMHVLFSVKLTDSAIYRGKFDK